MPILSSKNRSDYARYWRPRGSKFHAVKRDTIEGAVLAALVGYVQEFGHAPDQEKTIVEVNGDAFGFHAMVMELNE